MKTFAKVVVSALFILFFPHGFALANIEINEIMYDLKTGSDDGREWIEVYNNSDSAVDFSTFKFFESDTNHKILLKQGDANIPAYGYALIISDEIKFKTDWPSFSGTIMDSSFSLNNSGENLAIKDGEVIVDQYAYQASAGGAGNGKSQQKINGAWRESTPTPGAENKISYTPPPVPLPIKKPAIQAENKIEKLKPAETVETPVPEKNLEMKPVSPEEIGNNSPSPYFLFLILVILIGVGAGTVYFVRKKPSITQIEDDFEILD